MSAIPGKRANRVISYGQSPVVGCANLCIRTELLQKQTMGVTMGGTKIIPFPANNPAQHYNVLEGGGGGGGGGWLGPTAIIGLFGAVGTWKDEIYAGIGYLFDVMSYMSQQMGSAYAESLSQCWINGWPVEN